MKITYDAWVAAGTKRYGANKRAWTFRCPACSQTASVADWEQAGAPEAAVAYSCIGRWDQKRSCNYTDTTLNRQNPITIEVDGESWRIFDFADHPLAGPNNSAA